MSLSSARKLSVGLVGWRGMVGSVLMQRMSAERDFDAIETTFFSTSSSGKPAPKIDGCTEFDPILKDGNDLTALDRKSTRLNSSHVVTSRMPSSA